MSEQPNATGSRQVGAVVPAEEDVASLNRDTQLELGHARLQSSFDAEEDPQVTSHTFQTTVTPKTRVEEWERQKSLGGSGFGTVYLEKCLGTQGYVADGDSKKGWSGWFHSDNKTGELRAVKRIQKAQKQSYMSEASVRQLDSLAFFSGPAYEYHFVRSSGWYESPSALSIAMEYCPLGDMQSYLLDHGPVSEIEAKQIGRQMFSGIEFMHANNYVRGDLKPANLLIKSKPPTGEWWVKIANFGFCKDMKELAAPSKNAGGTLEFMPPELLGVDAGGRILSELVKGRAVDMWAAGETMFRILTGKAPFGDDFHLLVQYTIAKARFPRGALLEAGVSSHGVAFIEHCMAAKPSHRPSATYALHTLRWQRHQPNAFKGWKAKVKYAIGCNGRRAPFILFGPDVNNQFVVTRHKIHLCDMTSKKAFKTFTKISSQFQFWEFSQASVSPDGEHLCVTQKDCLKNPLLFNARTLEFVRELPDRLGDSGQGVKISAFSPNGKHLVIACNGKLSHFATSESSWRWIETYPEFLTPAHYTSGPRNIKSMALTTDGKRLVAAYENMTIIKNTSGPYFWETAQVIKYPGSASAVAVSPDGNIVACGTDKGELWLWTSEKNCWMRRVCSIGGPHLVNPPIETFSFSTTGHLLMFTRRGGYHVSLVRTVPLNQRDSVVEFAEFYGRSIGRTILYPGHGYGSTALGSEAGAEVVLWRYNNL